MPTLIPVSLFRKVYTRPEIPTIYPHKGVHEREGGGGALDHVFEGEGYLTGGGGLVWGWAGLRVGQPYHGCNLCIKE